MAEKQFVSVSFVVLFCILGIAIEFNNAISITLNEESDHGDRIECFPLGEQSFSKYLVLRFSKYPEWNEMWIFSVLVVWQFCSRNLLDAKKVYSNDFTIWARSVQLCNINLLVINEILVC